MNEATDPIVIELGGELGSLLEAFRQGREGRVPFSLVDILAMAALELTQAQEPVTAQTVQQYAGEHIWPKVTRESSYHEGTFESFSSILARRTSDVLWALQQSEPCEALLRVDSNPL